MAKNGTPPGAGLISGSHFQNFWIFARPPGFFELKIVVQPESDRVGPGVKFWFGAVGVPWVVHFFQPLACLCGNGGCTGKKSRRLKTKSS